MEPDAQALTIEGFIQAIKDFSFQEKYFKWKSYLKGLKEKESQYYQAALQKFVEYYPFNFTYWSELVDLLVKMPKGKVNTLKMYQVALSKNPKCISLWRKYLDWLRKQLTRSDPNYLRNQLEAATRSIGDHYKASFVFKYYFQMEGNVEKKYYMMKKAMVSPLEDIDEIFQIVMDFLDSVQFSPYTLQIAENEGLYLQQEMDRQGVEHILKQELKNRIIKFYEPTKQHVLERERFESKITIDEYQPYSDSIENWRQYISFIKNSGNHEFLPSIFERALMNQCDNESLWQQYFLILQNEVDHQRVLYLLRSHSLFFRTLSKQLTYYWLQIEERQNPAHARELYIDLEKTENDLEIFMRHIQLQTRCKQINNVRTLYLTILTTFTSNLDIISYIIIEYVQFSVKYFRDIKNAKLILKDYFQSYKYNEYLLINYLDFFVKYIEYKENTKESKQIADEFIDAILTGLRKAFEALPLNEYKRIKKRINNHMRNYILSIYLIKSAERKIKEQQISLLKTPKRHHEHGNNAEQSIVLKKVKHS